MLVIDYFSRYPEVCKLTSTTSNAVIQAMKNCFSHHGIPLIVRSDNGPQVDSEEFEKFSANYNFEHSTSSPRYPQSNGFVERGVKTVKNLLKKSQDPYLTLLNYRATPLSWCGRSPTELLMGRKVRTTLPQTQSQLIPKWPFLEEFKQKDTRFKNQQKRNYDKRHRVQEYPSLPSDTQVFVKTDKRVTSGTISSPSGSPRSYVVDTPTGSVRRNRQHLIPVPSDPPTDTPIPLDTSSRRSPIQTRSRTGTVIRPPNKLNL